MNVEIYFIVNDVCIFIGAISLNCSRVFANHHKKVTAFITINNIRT